MYMYELLHFAQNRPWVGPRGRSASVLAYDYPGLPLDMKKFKAASGELTASEMELVANQKRSPWPHQGG